MLLPSWDGSGISRDRLPHGLDRVFWAFPAAECNVDREQFWSNQGRTHTHLDVCFAV